MGTVGELEGFIVGVKDSNESRFKCSRFKTFVAATYKMTIMLSELTAIYPETFPETVARVSDLEDMDEIDFDIDYPVKITDIGNLNFLIGSVALMKERNVAKYDQVIKIEYDHIDCVDRCKYRDEEDEDLWHSNM